MIYIGKYLKKLKQNEKEDAQKLKHFNKVVDKILLSDSKNSNYKTLKENKIKGESDINPKLIFTPFEKNRRRH